MMISRQSSKALIQIEIVTSGEVDKHRPENNDEKFGLKINRNVCVSLAERDNRRIFTSRQRRLESSFEARRAKKIKRVKKLSCFRNRKDGMMLLMLHVISEAIDKCSNLRYERKIRIWGVNGYKETV
ncbi:hypothetical protein TNCV_3547351 [Trichonephila clavipes]|nr:hypothetical protein TNCV_3547351 [Trichonephila clavipes]